MMVEGDQNVGGSLWPPGGEGIKRRLEEKWDDREMLTSILQSLFE
jgi:hypothetical protein